MNKQEIVKFQEKADWYKKLIFDLKKLVFIGTIKIKWEIGKRIIEDELKFSKAKYGNKTVENIAKDLKISSREIWYYIQFAKKCDNVAEFMYKRWNWIVHNYLPEHKEEQLKQLKEMKQLKLPEGKFNVIYADPPWKYDFSKAFSDSIPAHYPVMDLDKICNLKIPSSDNAVLFLWVTNPKLEEAFQVINAWGFIYKTNFVWVKDKIGLGYYCRNQHELLLIAIKGNFSPPEEKNRVSSVIKAIRKKHSVKPEIVYDIIEKMYPNQKYLELFARNKRKKWSGWGLDYA